ncbi:MAG: hypothetical protein LBH05_05520, partial [Deferribacteraceae bacterium]|nr:hypothetical protein [Deferribacteraceae bacterium]
MKRLLLLMCLSIFLFTGCGESNGGGSSGGSGGGELLFANIPAGTKSIFMAKIQTGAASMEVDSRTLTAGEDDETLKDGAIYALLPDNSVKEVTFNENSAKAKFEGFNNAGRGYAVGHYGIKTLLIDGKSGKIYDLKVKSNNGYYPYDAPDINSVEVMGHYAYFTTVRIAYKVDLTDMTYIAYNNPDYDRFDDYLFFSTGDMLGIANYTGKKIFPASSAHLPYEPEFDMGVWSYMVKPEAHTLTDIVKYYAYSSWGDYYNDNYYYCYNLGFLSGNYNYTDVGVAHYRPSDGDRIYYKIMRDSRGEIYTLDSMKMFDQPVDAADAVNGSTVCKIDADAEQNQSYSDCYNSEYYLALNRWYLDNKVIKRETVSKTAINPDLGVKSLAVHSFLWDGVVMRPTRYNIQTAFDNDSFYRIDMTAASPVIDKTDWKLGNSLDDMMN